MGYSISVSMKSIKARDKFAAFLREHFRPWATIVAESEHFQRWAETHIMESFVLDNGGTLDDVRESLWRCDTSRYLCVGPEEIFYHSGKGTTKIGFNYGVSGPEREWQQVLLNWLALRGGRRRTCVSTTNGHVTAQVPYTCYDSEAQPVLHEADIAHVTDPTERRKLLWMVTDENGWRDARGPMEAAVDAGLVDPEEKAESDPHWTSLYKDQRENNRLTGLITKAEIERLEALWRKHG